MESNDMTPTDAVESARERDDAVLRVTHPWGQRADYAPLHDVLPSGRWACLFDGDVEGRVVEDAKVRRTAETCDPEVAVIPESDSLFNEGDRNE